MAKKHEIDIVIDDDGNVTFQVKGLKGKECLAVTKDFEEALGIIKTQEKTSEFYQTDTQIGTQIDQKKG